MKQIRIETNEKETNEKETNEKEANMITKIIIYLFVGATAFAVINGINEIVQILKQIKSGKSYEEIIQEQKEKEIKKKEEEKKKFEKRWYKWTHIIDYLIMKSEEQLKRKE